MMIFIITLGMYKYIFNMSHLFAKMNDSKITLAAFSAFAACFLAAFFDWASLFVVFSSVTMLPTDKTEKKIILITLYKT